MSTLDAPGPVVRASLHCRSPVEIGGDTSSMARSANGGLPLRSAAARRLPQAPRRPHAPPRLRQGPHAPPASARSCAATASSIRFEGVLACPDRYNAGRKFLFELEERGQAYVFARQPVDPTT